MSCSLKRGSITEIVTYNKMHGHECARKEDGFCDFVVPPFRLLNAQNFTKKLMKSSIDLAENPCEYFSCEKMYLSFLSKLKENEKIRKDFTDLLHTDDVRPKCVMVLVILFLILIVGLQILILRMFSRAKKTPVH